MTAHPYHPVRFSRHARKRWDQRFGRYCGKLLDAYARGEVVADAGHSVDVWDAETDALFVVVREGNGWFVRTVMPSCFRRGHIRQPAPQETPR